MGFPENYKKHESLGVCYKQIGNSVSVNVIKEISREIINQNLLSNEPQRKVIGDLQQLLYD
jgi:DNA (cytosine-5)-methyltransferase 1